MKKNILLILLSIVSFTAFSQQENHYTMFMYNKLMYNPAFAGAREVGSVMALYRGQWLGFKGAPTSQQIAFDAPLGKTRVGIGGTFSHHQIGIERNLMATMSYSYGLIQSTRQSLKLGIIGTYKNHQYDFSDPTLYIRDGAASDMAILAPDMSKVSKGNVGAGIYYNFKQFYLAASAPSIYQNKLGGPDNAAVQSRHYYAMLGAMIPISGNLDLKPAMMFRYVKNAPISVDINVSAMLKKKLTLGVSYRTDQTIDSESIDALMYVQVANRIGFGLSYDYTLSMLNKVNKGSVEALIRYDFGKNNEFGERYNFDNPRYFF